MWRAFAEMLDLTPVAIVAIAASVLLGTAVTPLPVVPLLLLVQSPVVAVRFPFVPLAPIVSIGAILVTVPAVVVAVFRIVNAHASGATRSGYGRNERGSQNQRSDIVQYSSHNH
jgi:hypothetical protein